MTGHTHFDSRLFDFLRELKSNNRREWFQANKERYREDVQAPMLRFIADFAGPLETISPHLVADPRPVGGSMFRIYRDVRFSKDKSPYKTHAAAQFRHREGKDVHTAGLYLHLESGVVHFGTGVWHPDGPTLRRIRQAIVDRPEAWKSAISDPGFTASHRLAGESLKRAPRGFPADHPLVEDLKRRDFVSMVDLPENEASEPGFLERFTESCRTAKPFMAFLTGAVGLEF